MELRSTVVLVRRLPACLRLPTAPSPVIRFTVVCRSTCTQHVWWPVLCHCRPRVWNSLPAELQQCSSLRQFKRCLKTFLFRSWDYGALWLSCKIAPFRNSLTYLLTYLCSLDPIPTFILRDCIDAVLPFLIGMVNASLREGYLPASQKKAVVTPLLKKPSLDAQDIKNYRPVSNLSFVSNWTRE